jgi:hypothetical protein
MDLNIKNIYRVMLRVYTENPWWKDWRLIEQDGKPGWLYGGIFEPYCADYGRLLEKYWISK